MVNGEDPIDRSREPGYSPPEEVTTDTQYGRPSTNLLHDRGLSTTVPIDRYDANGNKLNKNQYQRASRNSLWDTRKSQTERERSLKFALGEVQRMSSALGLEQPIREEAGRVLRQARQQDLYKGRSLEATATASLYMACRNQENPRTFDEVEVVSRVSKKKIVSAFQNLMRKLEEEVPVPDPGKYLPRYIERVANDIRADKRQNFRSLCMYVYKKYPEERMSGRSPMVVVGGIIYYVADRIGCTGRASHVNITQSYLAELCDVSSDSIRKVYHDIDEAL